MKTRIVRIEDMHSRKYDAAAERADNVIGSRISEARKKRGFTLTTFSEHLARFGVNVSRTAVNKWEVGDTVPSAYQLIAVMNALNLEDSLRPFVSDYVPDLNDEGTRKVEQYKEDLMACGKYRPEPRQKTVIRYIEMPVSGLSVSAGTGAFLDGDNFEMVSVPATTVPDGADFGVRVSGDSMEPVYHDRQIVWVRRCERLNVGEVGVFICDGEGFLKVYGEQEPEEDAAEAYTDSYGSTYAQPVLISYNQKYAPKVILPSSQLQIVGRVL